MWSHLDQPLGETPLLRDSVDLPSTPPGSGSTRPAQTFPDRMLQPMRNEPHEAHRLHPTETDKLRLTGIPSTTIASAASRKRVDEPKEPTPDCQHVSWRIPPAFDFSADLPRDVAVVDQEKRPFDLLH